MQKKSSLQEAKIRYPIVFVLVLFIVTLLAAGVFSAIINTFINNIDVSGSISRIIISVFIILLFYTKSNLKYSFRGFKFMLPLLLFGLYKIPLCFYTKGGVSDDVNDILVAVICGFAPAIYEEVLFRGILIDGLSKKRVSNLKTLFISASVFSLVHLTNIVGKDLIDVVFQVVFSFSCGLAFGGVYIKTKDICSVIAAHAITDIVGYMLTINKTDSYVVMILLLVLLILESLYGVWLAKRADKLYDE